MMAPQAQSTLKLYDKKWNEFQDKFSEDQGYQSVAGYRSAISAPLRHHTDLEVEKNIQLTKQIKGFKGERPRLRGYEPEWDLSFILWSLAHEPFDPIEDPKNVSL